MDYVLNQLTDLTLRRLYKFILKRTIGKYLEDELLIDQLQVMSREGVVKLKNLRFNVTVINEEFFQSAPVRLVSATVEELEVHVAYNTLLTESCRFISNKAEIIFEPNVVRSNNFQTQETEPTVDESHASEENNTADDSDVVSEDSQKGLSFIAHWIEIVVARLQVTLKNSTILLRTPELAAGVADQAVKDKKQQIAASEVRIEVALVEFFNTDPSVFASSEESTLALSSRLATGRGGGMDQSGTASAMQSQLLLQKLGAKKVVRIEGLRVSVETRSTVSRGDAAEERQPQYSHCLVDCAQQLKLVVKMESSVAGESATAGLDADLSVPSLLVRLDLQSADILLALLACYGGGPSSPTAQGPGGCPQGFGVAAAAGEQDLGASLLDRVLHSDHTLRTLAWLERQESSAGAVPGEIDFEKVARLMRQYEAARSNFAATWAATTPKPAGPLSFGIAGEAATVESDSEGEFPVSDPEDADEDSGLEDSGAFFDAVERRPVSKMHMGSGAGRNPLGGSASAASRGAGKALRASGLQNSILGKSSGRLASSSVFRSALQDSGLSLADSATLAGSAMRTENVFRLRLHVAAADICFTDSSATLTPDNLRRNARRFAVDAETGGPDFDELCLRIGDAVLLVNHASPGAAGASKVNLTFSEVSLREQRSADRRQSGPGAAAWRTMVDFHSNNRSAHVIFAPPQLDVSIEYRAGAASTGGAPADLTVNMTLEPMAVSFSLAQAGRWAAVLGQLAVGVAAEESANAFSLQLTLPLLEVLVKADEEVERATWRELRQALNLSAAPEQWAALPHGRHSNLEAHLGDGRCFGGYLFRVDALRLSLCSGPASQQRVDLSLPQSVEMSRVALSVFVADWDEAAGDPAIRSYFSARIASASVDGGGDCMVRVSRNETLKVKAGGRHRKCRPETGRGSTAGCFGSNVSVASQQSGLSAGSAGLEEAEEGYDLVSSSEDDCDEEEDGAGGDGGPGVGRRAGARLKGDDELGPRAPIVDASSVITVSAHMIEIDVRQREYNALMIVADTLSPPKSLAVAQVDPAAKKVSDDDSSSSPLSGGFGLVLHSRFAKICIAEKAAEQLHLPAFDAFLAEHGLKHRDVPLRGEDSDSFFLCVSIREPTIELRSRDRELFVSLHADDLGMYETSLEQFAALQREGFDFSRTSGRSARYGPDKFRVPFIHRASLHSKLNAPAEEQPPERKGSRYAGYQFGAHSTLLGDHKAYGHAFEVRLLLTSKAGAVAGEAEERAVHFFVDFHDIALSNDPASTWLLRVVKILSPQTAAQMIDAAAEEGHRQLLARYKQLSREHQLLLDVSTILPELRRAAETPAPPQSNRSSANSNHPDRGQGMAPLVVSPFEKTVIDVRVRDCLIDYCCEATAGRCMMTIGLLTLSSTIVSNSPRFALKFKVSGLALHLSNRLPALHAPERSSAPTSGAGPAATATSTAAAAADLDLNRFFESHAFVELLTVDHLDVAVVVNDSLLEALAIHVALGACCVNACADSLEVFAATVARWGEDFQGACAKAETILHKKKPPPLLAKDEDAPDAQEATGETGARSAESRGVPVRDPNDHPVFDKFRLCNDERGVESAREDLQGASQQSSAQLLERTPVDVLSARPIGVDGTVADSRHPVVFHRHLPALEEDGGGGSADSGDGGESGGAIADALLEDYYGAATAADEQLTGNYYSLGGAHDPALEHEARWLPQYDYDDEGDDGAAGGYYGEDSGLDGGDYGLGLSAVSDRGGPLTGDRPRSVDDIDSRRGQHDYSDSDDEESSFGHLGAEEVGRADKPLTSAHPGEIELESLGGAARRGGERSALNCDSFDLVAAADQPLSRLAVAGRARRGETGDVADEGDLLQFGDEAPVMVMPFGKSASRNSLSGRSDAQSVRGRGGAPKLVSNSDAIVRSAGALREMADLDRAWGDMDEDLLPSPDSSASSAMAGADERATEDLLESVQLEDEGVVARNSVGSSGQDPDVLLELSDPADAGESGASNDKPARSMRREQKAQWYDGVQSVDAYAGESGQAAAGSAGARGAGPPPVLNPHYIPIISGEEDLDDRRPAAERAVRSKVLVKIRATFRVRLFQGQDWATPSTSSKLPATRPVPIVDGSAAHGVGATATVSAAAVQLGKSVRFSDDGAGRLKGLTDSANDASAGKHSRPLFEEPRRKAVQKQRPSKHRPALSSAVPRAQRDMVEVYAKDAFLSIRMYETDRDRLALKMDSQLLQHLEGGSGGGPVSPVLAGDQVTAPVFGDGDDQTTLWRRFEPGELERLDSQDASDQRAAAVAAESATDFLTGSPLTSQVRAGAPGSSAEGEAPLEGLPAQRVAVSAQDLLVSYGKVGQRRRKVLGPWASAARPRDMYQPMLQVSVVGHDPPLSDGERGGQGTVPPSSEEAALEMEHKLFVRLLPVRVYLDGAFVDFVKKLVAVVQGLAAANSAATATQQEEGEHQEQPVGVQRKSPDMFFRSISVTATDIKIDYRAGTVDLRALHGGDYLQLLNIFPLEGLEVTLKRVDFRQVCGLGAWMDRALEVWVRDIYANQLHRVVSGTAPFAGVANIGADIHQLFAVPMSDYRRSGGLMSHLSKSTRQLVRTVTKETLNAAHKVTMMVANALTDLASDSPTTGEQQHRLTQQKGGRTATSAEKTARRPIPSAEYKPVASSSARRRAQQAAPQPTGLMEGLQRAFSSVSREVGSAVDTVIAVPIRQYEETGPGGYVRSVLRALPIAVIRPVAGVAEGLSFAVLGLRNDLDPGARYDDEDIWNIEPPDPRLL